MKLQIEKILRFRCYRDFIKTTPCYILKVCLHISRWKTDDLEFIIIKYFLSFFKMLYIILCDFSIFKKYLHVLDRKKGKRRFCFLITTLKTTCNKISLL